MRIAWAADYDGPSETVCGGPMPNGRWWSPWEGPELLFQDRDAAGRASLARARKRLVAAEELVRRLEAEFGQ